MFLRIIYCPNGHTGRIEMVSHLVMVDDLTDGVFYHCRECDTFFPKKVADVAPYE